MNVNIIKSVGSITTIGKADSSDSILGGPVPTIWLKITIFRKLYNVVTLKHATCYEGPNIHCMLAPHSWSIIGDHIDA
jgi:hypothetical protein